MDNKNIKQEQIVSILQEEYFYLQKSVDEYDKKSLTIKGWSITFSLAILVGAFVKCNEILLLISSFSALLFWIIDWYWKQFQNANYARLFDIERFISGREIKDFRYLNVTGSWFASFKSNTKSKKVKLFFLPQTHLPYSIILAFGFIIFTLNQFYHFI